MADYSKSFKVTVLGNEGGYNPGIKEHETYKGIDRGANPHWSGWVIIDAIKLAHPDITVKQMNTLLAANAPMQADIYQFFLINYWNPVKLTKINDQQIANNLFDCSVNQGEGIARRFLQTACNQVITDAKSSMKPLVVDGIIGPLSLIAINSLSAPKLMAKINLLRETRYKNTEDYDEWGEIWLARLLKYV